MGVTPRDALLEISRQPDRRPLSELPRLVHRSLNLVWMSGRRELAITTGLQVIGAIAIGLQLLAVQQLIATLLSDNGQSHNWTRIGANVALLAGLSAVIAFTSAVQPELQRLLTELVARKTTLRVLDVSTSVELAAFDRAAFYDRMVRAQAGSGARPFQLTQSLLTLMRSAVTTLGVVAALFLVLPILVPLVAVALVPAWIANRYSSRAFYSFAFGMTPNDRRRGYLFGLMTDRDAAKEIRAFGLGSFLKTLYDRLYVERISDLRRLGRMRMLTSALSSVATAVLIAAVLLLLVELVVTGQMNIPQAGAALAAVIVLSFSLQGIITSASQLYECTLFLNDYESFVAAAPHVQVAPVLSAEVRAGDIAVEDVTFAYSADGPAALRNVSLEIRKGEVVALVGENGSGKTTLAKLICGLYRPNRGRIVLDGTDIASIDPNVVRRSTSVIFQDFVRYMLTARDNIALGDPERFDDFGRVIEAAKSAGADEILSRLPRGYDTMLGPVFHGGVELSGGEWQRVALARAFFRGAPFIILDEPTASLDPRSEQELFRSVRQLCQGRSVLLISHRFSTVRSADRIYVLQRGTVIESGTHEQLMARDGLYAELFSLQASAYVGPRSPIS